MMKKKLYSLMILLVATMSVSACNDSVAEPQDPTEITFPRNLNVDLATMTKTSTGLYIKDETVGTGDVVATGDNATVTYTGWLSDGVPFDQGTYTVENVGNANVIAGWNEGLKGMRVGGKRLLVIPYQLGYGEGGNGPIPPYAVLVFRIELKSVVKR